MMLTGKDLAATCLTAMALLTFAAAHESWNVWLIGSSNHWAAGAILLLGWLTCTLGSPTKGRASMLLAAVGVVALATGVWAIWTASMTALWVLVVAIVILWISATIRHASQGAHRPIAT